MTTMNAKTNVILLATILLAGCDPATDSGLALSGVGGIYVINEGAFTAGNAELSYIDPTKGAVSGAVFSTKNPGKTLGDIAQSATLAFGRLFVVVNNSRKIEVVEPGTHASLQTISLSTLPRAICVVTPSKAYVTNMDSTVSILDLGAGAEVNRLTVGTFPEGIIASGELIYVLNGGFGYGTTISVINMLTDSVVRTILTPYGPSYGLVTSAGFIHVVCTGYQNFSDPLDQSPGALLTLNASTGSVIDTLWFNGVAGKLASAGDGTLFILGPGSGGTQSVWKVSGGASPATLSPALVVGSYYGIGVDPERLELYLALPGDFVSNGRVEVRSLSGSFVREYVSGIGVAPNGFVFTN